MSKLTKIIENTNWDGFLQNGNNVEILSSFFPNSLFITLPRGNL